MKKRYTGGLAIGIFALGFILSQFWDFGGLGIGESDNASDSESSVSADSSSSSETNTDADLSNVSAGGTLQTSTSGPSTLNAGSTQKFVTISIHEDRYRLTSEEDPQTGVDVSLAEVVRRAKEATGGEQGIKLRILFQKNAQEGALADLHAAMADVGVKREEIQEISGYID